MKKTSLCNRLISSPVWSAVLVALFLFVGLLFFDWFLVLIEVLLGVSCWFLLMKSRQPKCSQTFVWLIVGLLSFFALFFTRIFPFFISDSPLGYDTGIYRFEFWSSFSALPEYISGLFLGLPLLSDIFLLFGGSVDQMISGGYIIVALLLPVMMVFFAKKIWSRDVGMIVLLLFLFSIVQWKAYTMILYKQVLALSVVFFSLFWFYKRSYWVLVPLVFLALLQPLDAFLLCLAVSLYALLKGLWERNDRSFFLVLAVLGLFFSSFLFYLDAGFWQVAWNVFSQAISDPTKISASLQAGVFLSLADFGYQASFFFVFGLLGFFLDLKERKLSVFSCYFLVVFIWIALRLFFYQRLLIQLDALLIFFSAFLIHRIFSHLRQGWWRIVLLILFFIGLVIPSILALYRFRPLISPDELSEIQAYCDDLPEGVSVIATDSYYASWLRGYCLNQNVSGPGLFGNPWSLDDWKAFWSGDEVRTRELVSQYEGKVYFYHGENQSHVPFIRDLFEPLGGGWWRLL